MIERGDQQQPVGHGEREGSPCVAEHGLQIVACEGNEFGPAGRGGGVQQYGGAGRQVGKRLVRRGRFGGHFDVPDAAGFAGVSEEHGDSKAAGDLPGFFELRGENDGGGVHGNEMGFDLGGGEIWVDGGTATVAHDGGDGQHGQRSGLNENDCNVMRLQAGLA